MALDPTSPKTRRAILAGACGGAAALAVTTLGRPAAVLANDPFDVVLGKMNQETSCTGFNTSTRDDTAVQGISSATTGWGCGVHGEVASTDGGTGVVGKASATTGNGTGVHGEAASPGGSGVVGSATATSGDTWGVQGDAASPDGTGVSGSATATTGRAVGVDGSSESTEGIGVRASASAATGETLGVYAECSSPDGTAVYANSQALTGGAGVAGWCESHDGVGVSGFGGARGVWGDSAGTGVYGHSGKLSGVLGFAGLITMGVPGPSPAAKTGVFGYSDIDAASVGVRGQATTGVGVRAIATTGTALYCTTASAKSGTALRTIGRVRFDSSVGIATIRAGKSSVVVTPGIDLGSTSAVVATLQANPSGTITVQGVVVNASANTLTICLTGKAGSSMKVAWHVFG